jgi:quercetin dioxygenase-like cupin family protein
MIAQGTILTNALNGETFIFSGPIDDPAVARFDVRLAPGGSGGGDALVHIHPGAHEHFMVRSGRLKVMIGGKSFHLGPGEQVAVPRGTPHCFANDHDGVSELTVMFTPPEQHLRFFANFASLAAHRTEWFSQRGEPDFLLIALALHSYRGHLYLAGPPVWLQRLLFAVLAPLARLRGYRLEIGPRQQDL